MATKSKAETVPEEVTPAPVAPGTVPAHVDLNALTDDELVARVVPGDDTPVDGLFRKAFQITRPLYPVPGQPDPATDWRDEAQFGDMHRANAVCTLQEALNHGVHARETPYLESVSEHVPGGRVDVLTYACRAVPASRDLPEVHAVETVTPNKALFDMGGSTIQTED